MAERFLAAGLTGDVDGLLATLAPDVVLTSDGGGVVHAAVRPVVGRDRVGRFVTNLMRRLVEAGPIFEACELNGTRGGILRAGDTFFAYTIESDTDHVTAIRVVLNPAKLGHLIAKARF